MNRTEIAPGAHLTSLAGEKFKRYKINIHLVVENSREDATALAILPHILERRCTAIPDATALSRRLFDLYGAELTGESYTAGPNRVVTLGISGLKGRYALEGEDLETEGLRLLCELLFAPVVEQGAFSAEDAAIETAKQADFLRNEMNDKRGYCIRQARRKLYGDTPLGIESAGYLEDIDGLDAAALYRVYTRLLEKAAVEVVTCGVHDEPVLAEVGMRLAALKRSPASPSPLQAAVHKPEGFEHFSEPMDTVQGKLCILLTNGSIADVQQEATLRMASAILGGLPTSRLFTNVREKQSLCYYCTSIYGSFSGTLQMDSGVDHANAEKAAAAMLYELKRLQQEAPTEEEMTNARRALATVLSAAQDSPDALAGWVFNEWLRGTNLGLEDYLELYQNITGEEIRAGLAGFVPAVEYRLVGKEGAR